MTKNCPADGEAWPAFSEVPKVFGLHVSRTGGTTIAQVAREALGASQCFIVSSFRQTSDDHEVLPQERLANANVPMFVFGHYVHESMWVLMKKASPVISFTVYRDPISRLESEVAHMLNLGVSEEAVIAQCRKFPNPWCREILRAFPTISLHFKDRPIHERCMAALALFDMVVPIEEIGHLISRLLEQWEKPPHGGLIKLNQIDIASAKAVASRLDPVGQLGEDQALYSALLDGKAAAHHIPVEELVQLLLASYPNRNVALNAFFDHLDKYFLDEVALLSNSKEMAGYLLARKEALERVVKKLQKTFDGPE